MALNVFALTAYYLHPAVTYDNSKLSTEQIRQVNEFLLKKLNAEGLESLDNFKPRQGIFQIFFEEKPLKPLEFGGTAVKHHPTLYKLALRLLLIPASSAQLERVTREALIHTPLRNRLTFERSKKLMHIYYNLQLRDLSLQQQCNAWNDDFDDDSE
ncbi:hAT family C-terminal dimerization region [Popillia japonica]|uniref:HAT family C-terminal dimerization region n=1 Tax=Popillia japonica TaxID=7064 RepID=A0AAW1IYG8_POPJA